MPAVARFWIISDTHFGHTQLQKHTRRPPDVDLRILTAWKRLIAPYDIVFHLGDVAWSSVYRTPKTVSDLLGSLPGTKVLVRGNHDSHGFSWWFKAGFAAACDGLVVSGLWLTHKPSSVLPPGCRLNVHGHLHNKFPEGHRVFPWCRLMALEYTNYEPRQFKYFV